MPFDGVDLSPVTQALIAARQRIEAGWCQYTALREEKVCLAYALGPGTHLQSLDAWKFMRCVIGIDVVGWNDTPGRTREDVLAVLDRAIELSLLVVTVE